MSPASSSLTIGQSGNIFISSNYNGASYHIAAVWSSSNGSVATAAYNSGTGGGLITAQGAGSATITASFSAQAQQSWYCAYNPSCGNVSYTTFTANASVSVLALNDNGVGQVESFATILSPQQIKQNVAAWDAAILAAMISNFAQQGSIPSYHFPLFLSVTSECSTVGGTQPMLTTNIVRNRTYTLLDEYQNVWPTTSRVTIYEVVTQTSGTHTIVGDGSWTLAAKSQLTDYLSDGGVNNPGISPVGAIQQFYAVGSFATSTIPLIIWDQVSAAPGRYGTLGNYYQASGISINGDNQAGVPVCR